jgi:hypothetical protein
MKIGEDFHSRQRLKFGESQFIRPIDQAEYLQPPFVRRRQARRARSIEHRPLRRARLARRNAIVAAGIGADYCICWWRRRRPGLILRVKV